MKHDDISGYWPRRKPGPKPTYTLEATMQNGVGITATGLLSKDISWIVTQVEKSEGCPVVSASLKLEVAA